MQLFSFLFVNPPTDITIGFEQTTYSVREDDGSIEVCTIIRTGNLQTSVTVTMATVDGTAVGMYVML